MLTPPTSGKLRHKLRFERRGEGPNVAGVVADDWEELIESVRASVEPALGGEAVIAGRMSGRVQHNIMVRSSVATRGLTNADRAVNIRTGEIYALGQPIDPWGMRQWLLIQAVSAGNAAGEGER